MRLSIRIGLLSSAFTALQALPVAVLAQATDASTQQTLQEVIVTAQKRNERLQDVPVPVTAINASSLVDSNQLDVKDYYTSVPGLSVAPGNLGSTVTIRGLAQGSGNPTVGIVVDDVPYGAATFLGAGGVVPDFDPSELARIEVLRGPQGTLYGANSLGGLIKYVTLDPSTDRLSGHVQVGTSGVYNGNQAGYNVRGAVNIPLNQSLAVRISAFTRRDPGYIDNIQTGAHDVNRTDSEGGRLSALWRPVEDFSMKLSALIQDNKIYGLPYTYQGLGDLQQSTLRGTGVFNLDSQAYSLTTHAKFGKADLTAISGYSVYKANGFNDFTYAFGPPTQALFGVGGAALDNPATAKKFTQEVRLSVPLAARADWLIGAFYTHENSEQDTDLFAVNPDTGVAVGQWVSQPAPTTYTEYAAFTDLTLHFTDQFDVQFGGRGSEIRQAYSTSWNGPYVTVVLQQQDPLVPPPQKTQDSTFTYLLSPRFKISPDLMIYARLASGYRPGGPNSNSSVNKLATYSPDKTQNYEIGFKGDVLDHVLSFDASIYYINWKDVQLLVIDPTTQAGIFVNAGEAKSQGVELSMESRPLPGLTLAAWIAFDEAQLTQDLPSGFAGAAVGFAGDRLPVSSRFSGNFSLNQEFSLPGNMTGFAGAAVSYVGERLGNFQSAGVARQIFPSYAQTNLHGGVRYDAWTASVFVNNVTDKRGLLPSGSNGLINPSANYLIQPRTVGLNISRTF